MDELLAECRKLQSTLSPFASIVCRFTAAHPSSQAQLSQLLEEVIGLPEMVDALERAARACAQEQGLLAMIRSVPDVCLENLRQISAVLCSDQPGLVNERWRELAAEAATLATFLATGRRTLNLATDSLEL